MSLRQAHELIVATPDWRMAARTPIVIGIEAFEAAQSDPSWLAFCQKADEYVSAFAGTNQTPIKDSPG